MNLLDSYGKFEEQKVEVNTKLVPVSIMCVSFNQDKVKFSTIIIKRAGWAAEHPTVSEYMKQKL